MKWPVKKLGNFIEIVMGQAPHSDQCNKEGEGVVFVKAGEFGNESPVIREWTTDPLKMAKADDTLICVVGATAGKINRSRFECAIGRSVAAVRTCSKQVEQNYLHAFLSTKVIELRNRSQGAAQAVITREMLQDIEIPLPPLAEQQRIAALLDTADRILKQRELAIAKLDQLAQSVFVDMFSNCTNFESIKSVVLKNKITPPEVDQQVWSLSLDQIESNTGTLQNKMMVDFKKLGNSTFYFEPPVVLYSKLRPYLNKVFMPTDCGYATTELVPLYCNEKKVLPIYLLSVLRSKKFVEFANINSGGAKMPRVIMDKFWDYEFAVPSIQQQQKYADFFTSILNQKRYCLHVYSLNKALLSSLQHQSFAVN